jgi:hypothetical protein
LANPKLDMIYYEPQLGGHNTLGAFNSPVLYDWLFAHTLAVPEPDSAVVLSPVLLSFMAARRKHGKNFQVRGSIDDRE